MKYIDKLDASYSISGCQETQKILDSHWQNGCYLNLQYNRGEMDDMTEILLKQQDNLCCYCMRRIENNENNVTLEHIIPDNISADAWIKDGPSYRKFAALDPARVDVCPGGKLGNPSIKITRQPYPHFVSYHNLVASCDGRLIGEKDTSGNYPLIKHHCCNNKRGSDFVLPIYLLIDIANRMSYDKKGNLDFDPDDFDAKWFGKDGLNIDCIQLNNIRRFWYLLSKSQYSVQDVIDAYSNNTKREDILDDVVSGPCWTVYYKNVYAWKILIEYKWFYDYYKAKP